jgi:hypothetical protein
VCGSGIMCPTACSLGFYQGLLSLGSHAAVDICVLCQGLATCIGFASCLLAGVPGRCMRMRQWESVSAFVWRLPCIDIDLPGVPCPFVFLYAHAAVHVVVCVYCRLVHMPCIDEHSPARVPVSCPTVYQWFAIELSGVVESI